MTKQHWATVELKRWREEVIGPLGAGWERYQRTLEKNRLACHRALERMARIPPVPLERLRKKVREVFK